MTERASIVDYAMAIARAGSAAALALAFGTVENAANRVGLYADLTASAEQLSVVVGGVQGPVFQRSGANVVATGLRVQDSTFQIADNGDLTKTIAFQCASMGTGFQLTIDSGAQAANRTLSAPVLTGNRTLAVVDQDQEFTTGLRISQGQNFKTSGAGAEITFQSVDRADVPVAFKGSAGTTFFAIYAPNVNYMALYTALRYVFGSAAEVNSSYTAQVAGSLYVQTNALIAGTTASTNTTTGSLINTGGFGNGGAAFFGGNVTIGGLTADRVPFTGVGGLLSTSNELQFNIANYTYGAGTAATVRVMKVDGGASGVACGAAMLVQNGAASIIGISNYSALFGGAYDATPTIFAASEIRCEAALKSSGALTSTSATAGVGYAAGSGGAVTQITSRATGVTLNKVCGQITLVSAAGSAAWTSFTVTNSAVATTDEVRVCQDSGTDKYQIHVTAVGTGSFEVTFATTGGTTVETPVFTFTVTKAVTS